MKKLQGKTALITGASRGIGRAIAEEFGQEGANIIVNYVSNEAAANDVVSTVSANGVKAVACQGDTTDPEAIRNLFQTGEETFDGLDIVVLNAHPGLGHGAITKLDDDTIDGQLSVLKGYIVALQEAGKRLNDNGVIICISSSATRIADPNIGLYGAVKLSIEHLARSLSRELASRNIRVLSISPGLTRTDRMDGLDFGDAPVCDPIEIAHAALFLASGDAKWINTTTLYVNSGTVYAQ